METWGIFLPFFLFKKKGERGLFPTGLTKDAMKRRLRKEFKRKFSDSLNKRNYPSEKHFHRLLERKGITGFHRNKPIGKYFADFSWKGLKLIIEIDGLSHIGREDYDQKRDAELQSLGWTVLRIKYPFDYDLVESILTDLRAKTANLSRPQRLEKLGKTILRKPDLYPNSLALPAKSLNNQT